jgi:hypothetical protein
VLGGRLNAAGRAEHSAQRRAHSRRVLELIEQGWAYMGCSSSRETHGDGTYTESLRNYFHVDFDDVAHRHVQAHLERRERVAADAHLERGERLAVVALTRPQDLAVGSVR